MIVKNRDAQASTIHALEVCASQTPDSIKRTACLGAAARLRTDATSEPAESLVNQYFADSEEWAIIHDLRLTVDGHAIQLNHLLINSSLHFFVIDSRWLRTSMQVSDTGMCTAIINNKTKPVASPLAKMAKDLRKLNALVAKLQLLPKRFGLSQKLTAEGYVLTNNRVRVSANCPRPEHVAIQPGDTLFNTLWKRDLKGSKLLGSCLTPEQLYDVAWLIREQHKPVYNRALLAGESVGSDHSRSLLAAC